MKREDLELIIKDHAKWLADPSTGRRANLRHVDLRHADLRNVDLRHADLRYADFSYANLYNANLRYANLRYANLYNTNLRNVDLYNVNGCAWVCDGNHHHLTNIGSECGVLEMYSCGDNGWLIIRGCFVGSVDEFILAVKETHGDNDHARKYLGIIELLTK